IGVGIGVSAGVGLSIALLNAWGEKEPVHPDAVMAVDCDSQARRQAELAFGDVAVRGAADRIVVDLVDGKERSTITLAFKDRVEDDNIDAHGLGDAVHETLSDASVIFNYTDQAGPDGER